MAILADNKNKLKPNANLSTSDENDPNTRKQVKLPLFARKFKQTSNPESQIWNSVTY